MSSTRETFSTKDYLRKGVAVATIGFSALSLTACGEQGLSAEPAPKPSATESVGSTAPATPEPTPSVSDIPTTTPTGIETTEPSEGAKEFEVVPLREWDIDPTLFEGWSTLSEEQIKENATVFFDSNIKDENYHSRSLDTGPLGNTVETATYDLYSELGVVSDLYLDETVENGTTMASNLLDAITREVGTDNLAKEAILADLKLTRELMVEDEYCVWESCFALRDDFKLDKILKTSTEMVNAADLAGNPYIGYAATVGVKYNSTPYSPTSIHTTVVDMSDGKKLVSWGNEIFFQTAAYDPGDPETIIAEIPEVKEYLDTKM